MCRRLGLDGDPLAIGAVFDELVRRYDEPQRKYHTLEHIQACLEELDLARETSVEFDRVEAAIWFHDAVYDPRADDNEERSAELTRRALARWSARGPLIEVVARLILATRHTTKPQRDDEALIVDVDLTILGQPGEIFDAYERAIRAEYDWVDDNAFARARATILRAFLNRPRIYTTALFFERYEESARDNLRRSLRRLGD